MAERPTSFSPTDSSVAGPHPNPLPAIPGEGTKTIALAVLISGGGTTLQNLIDRIAANQLSARIKVVIASRPGIKGIDRAKAADIQTHVIVRKEFATAEAFSDRIFSLCDTEGIDLICLAGWLQLLRVPERWMGRVMNIHPALLPKYGGKGMFGRHVHEAVLAAGESESGCTVHFVDNAYDAGPIILQRTCPVFANDSADTLAARVFEQECRAYPAAIDLFRRSKLRIEGRGVRILNP